MNFKELLLRAQAGDQRAQEKLLSLYQPLLMKEAVINGVFDEDVYQELCITLLTCIQLTQKVQNKRKFTLTNTIYCDI